MSEIENLEEGLPDGCTNVTEALALPAMTGAGEFYMSPHFIHRFKERVLKLHRRQPLNPRHVNYLLRFLQSAKLVEDYKQLAGKCWARKEERVARQTLMHGEEAHYIGAPYTPTDQAGWIMPYLGKFDRRDDRPTIITMYPVRKLVLSE